MTEPSGDPVGDVHVLRRVAAIDCGTNSVRLLIADRTVDGLRERVRLTRIVRLGQDVDRTRRLADGALARTEAALADYAEEIQAYEVGDDATRMVATSAVRDVENRDAFVAMVRRRLGLTPDVVTGDEEARLSFAGVAAGVSTTGPLLVADLGGGSTELVLGDASTGNVHSAHSMDVGSVRLTERHFVPGDEAPPTAAELAAAEADVDAALDLAATRVDLTGPATLVGVAGTVTTLAAMTLRLDHYDWARVHGAVIPADGLLPMIDELLAMTRTERTRIPVLHPGRVDVIDAGAVILRQLVRRVGAHTLVISENDILDGVALSITDGTDLGVV